MHKDFFSDQSFSKIVDFPTALFTYEYLIESETHMIPFSKHETFTNLAELIQNAYLGYEAVAESADFECNYIFVIPLLFKSTHALKKSNWKSKINEAESSINKALQVTKVMDDFNDYSAIVTCSYYPEEHNQNIYFSCAGYFKSGDKKDMQTSISESMAPADPLVRDFAEYEIIRPYTQAIQAKLLN